MAFAEHHPPQLAHESAPERLTFRAVVLGVATILFSTWYLTYYAGNLVKSFFPVGVLIPFVSWVGLNILLKTLAPRLALSRTELVTILSMMWVAGNLPAVGWALHSVSLVPSPEFYASPENRLRDAAIPFLPQWLFWTHAWKPSAKRTRACPGAQPSPGGRGFSRFPGGWSAFCQR